MGSPSGLSFVVLQPPCSHTLCFYEVPCDIQALNVLGAQSPQFLGILPIFTSCCSELAPKMFLFQITFSLSN